MPEYDNSNSGAIFPNTKRTTDKHPNLTGSLNVGGTDYWLSAWKKEDKNGNPYYSLAVKPKDEQAKPAGKSAAKPAPKDDLDDLI